MHKTADKWVWGLQNQAGIGKMGYNMSGLWAADDNDWRGVFGDHRLIQRICSKRTERITMYHRVLMRDERLCSSAERDTGYET